MNWGLGSLSGKPVWPGDRFTFGCEFGALTLWTPTADRVVATFEAAGLSYDTVAAEKSGTVRPFIQAEGVSSFYWEDSEDFKTALFQSLQASYNPNWGKVNFWVNNDRPGPDNRVGSTGSTPNNDQRPPDPKGPSFFEKLADDLDVTKETAQMVVIGGALIFVLILAKR